MVDLTAALRPSTFAQRLVASTRELLGTEASLLHAFRTQVAPTAPIDSRVYRDLAELFEAIEDDEDNAQARDCDALRTLADSLDAPDCRRRPAPPALRHRRSPGAQ